jgi:hypothetical protein
MGTTTFLLQIFLPQLAGSLTKSSASFFWSIVAGLWSNHWLFISIFLILWVIFEILTRNGSAYYNSKNGFSPTFNRVVVSGVYLLLQAIVYLVLHFIFGDSVYIHYWPYFLHLIVFISTGLLLNLCGFWVYLKPSRF